jgi:hypothetical protein
MSAYFDLKMEIIVRSAHRFYAQKADLELLNEVSGTSIPFDFPYAKDLMTASFDDEDKGLFNDWLDTWVAQQRCSESVTA